MTVRVVKDFTGAEGTFTRGQEVEIAEPNARYYMAVGFVVPMHEDDKPNKIVMKKPKSPTIEA